MSILRASILRACFWTSVRTRRARSIPLAEFTPLLPAGEAVFVHPIGHLAGRGEQQRGRAADEDRDFEMPSQTARLFPLDGEMLGRHVGGAADLVANVSILFKLHLVLGLTIFLVFPFTRLVHIWSGFASVFYLLRPYQVVRGRGGNR